MAVSPGNLTGFDPSQQDDSDAEQAGVPAAEPDERAQPEPKATAQPESKPSAQVREYVVLERQQLDDGEACFVEVGRVSSRNGPNALRRAAREHFEDLETHHLVAVPATQWQPKPTRRKRNYSDSIEVG